jgi:hypothetical protein
MKYSVLLALVSSSAEAYRLIPVAIHSSDLLQLSNEGIFDRMTKKIEKEENEKQEAIELIKRQ